MPDRPWKKWERDVAAMIGGTRKPANSGHEIDAESPAFVAQCKHVSRLGLPEIVELAMVIGEQGAANNKIGVLAIKLKQGVGFPSPEIIVMTTEQFQKVAAPVITARAEEPEWIKRARKMMENRG